MNLHLRIRQPYRLLWLPLIAVFMSYSCQKDMNQVVNAPALDLVAPSGARIANSADELRRNIASATHEDAGQIKVLGINYVDTPSGYGGLVRFVNQKTKEVNSVAIFRFATVVTGQTANLRDETTNYGYCSCGVNYIVSANCEPLLTKVEGGYALKCAVTPRATAGCVAHMGML